MKSVKLISLTSIIFFLCSCGMENQGRVTPKLREQAVAYNPLADCDPNSGPVCGQPPMPPCPQGMGCSQVMPPIQTYASMCELIQADAAYIKYGDCPENGF